MSILVKGMPMPPKDGRAHRAIIKQHDGEFILLVEDAKDFEDRHMDVYPLIEVPEPHGDLLDRDAHIDNMQNHLWDWDSVNGIETGTALKQAITDLWNEPVVIRKEGYVDD